MTFLNGFFIERSFGKLDIVGFILKTGLVLCVAAIIAVVVLPVVFIVHYTVNPYYPEGHPCYPYLGRDTDCELQVRQAVALETLAENLLYINVGQ